MSLKEKLKTIFMKEYITHFLAGALGAALILAIYQTFISIPPKFVTIHLTKLMDEYVKSEVEKKRSKEELSQDVKNYAQQLERALHHFAQTKHLILIPKEAAIAGIPDETEWFLHEFHENK